MNAEKEKSAVARVQQRPKYVPDHAIEYLAARFESLFREPLRPLRKIGKEAEFPVVTREGRAADVTAILQRLVAEHGFSPRYDSSLLVAAQRNRLEVAVEVGRGTIELALPPCDDLWQLEKEYHRTIELIVRVAASVGAHLLGFGIQPRTPASLAQMTPRKHYRALYGAIGAPWLKLTTTAADQTHIDIARTELLGAINYLNLLSAPLIALCANSSVYAGRAGKFVSGREGLLKDLGETRYGMTPRKFDSIQDFIRYICEYRCFVLSEKHNYKKFNRPFSVLLTSESDGLFDEFLWHEHYVWNSARARVATSTIEVRPACQQPRDEPLAANALILGWVESLPRLDAYFRNAFGENAWQVMRAYRRAAVRDGLQAREPAKNFMQDVLRIAEEGLKRRGRGEEKFILPIWERLERRESPGVRARKTFQRRGIEGLLQEFIIQDPKE